MSEQAAPTGVCLFTAGALAERLGADLVGDEGVTIERVGPIDDADARTLTFIRDEKRAALWLSSRAGSAIVSRALAGELTPGQGRALLFVDDADLAMIEVLEALTPAHVAPPAGAHATAVIDPSATVAPDAHIGAHVVVGPGSAVGAKSALHANVVLGANVRVGEGCDLRAGVVIEDGCSLADRVTLHPGVVIGADGFGYRPAPGGQGILKIPHAGGVRIESDVEIGANTTVDRGKFGDTVIGEGTKIDNLVQIGHNCRIGRCCIICGTVGIAGSVKIGDGATIGGGAGVRDNITIGAGAQVGAGSGVMADIPPGEGWAGVPAYPVREALRSYSALRNLPETIRSMQKEIKRLRDNQLDP